MHTFLYVHVRMVSIRNSNFESASDSPLFAAQGQVTFLFHVFLSTEGKRNVLL